MNNKTKKAVDALNGQLSALEAISNEKEGENWQAALKDMLILYTGESSSMVKRVDELSFTTNHPHTVPNVFGSLDNYIYDESLKKDFVNLINAALSYIQYNGVYKHTNGNNILQSFSNAQIISGAAASLVFLCTLAFKIGVYKGTNGNEQKVRDAESTVKTMTLERQKLDAHIDSLTKILHKLKHK